MLSEDPRCLVCLDSVSNLGGFAQLDVTCQFSEQSYLSLVNVILSPVVFEPSVDPLLLCRTCQGLADDYEHHQLQAKKVKNGMLLRYRNVHSNRAPGITDKECYDSSSGIALPLERELPHPACPDLQALEPIHHDNTIHNQTSDIKVLALSVLAVAAAAPQGYGAPSQGYGAPVGGSGSGVAPRRASYGSSQGAGSGQSRDAQARTLREENINNGDGTYRFSFETDNGITREEQGDGTQVTGSYSYTADDGTPVEITFVADENGFQPEGDALPTPVPTEYPTPEVPSTEAAGGSYGAPSAAAGSYSAPGTPSRSYGAF